MEFALQNAYRSSDLMVVGALWLKTNRLALFVIVTRELLPLCIAGKVVIV